MNMQSSNKIDESAFDVRTPYAKWLSKRQYQGKGIANISEEEIENQYMDDLYRKWEQTEMDPSLKYDIAQSQYDTRFTPASAAAYNKEREARKLAAFKKYLESMG